MFVQIVECLTKFAGLLNDASKLSGTKNRKKLAVTLVQLYTLLSRIADNAERIHAELRSVYRHICDPQGASFESLGMLLGDQRQMLKELQDLVRDNEALINVYGNNVADEIVYIASLKVSLIDVITTLALYQADNFGGAGPSTETGFLGVSISWTFLNSRSYSSIGKLSGNSSFNRGLTNFVSCGVSAMTSSLCWGTREPASQPIVGSLSKLERTRDAMLKR